MEINGTESTMSDYSAQSNPLKSSQNQLGTDAFFKILSAQLQYQDPLKSADNTEYIAQMAQFSALEELQNLSNSFQQMMLRQDLIIAGQMLGNQAAVHTEDELIRGIVEGYTLSDTGLLIAIDGKEYPFEKVAALMKSEEVSIQEGTSEEEKTLDFTHESQE